MSYERQCVTGKLFYHLVDIAVVNTFVIYNIKATAMGAHTITENDFWGTLVLQIIEKNWATKEGRTWTWKTLPVRVSSKAWKQGVRCCSEGKMSILSPTG